MVAEAVLAGALTICGMTVPAPAGEPSDASPPVLLAILLCFEKQGGASVIEPQTYLHYIRTRPSEPSRDVWIPYDDAAEAMLLEDFRRLWATNFLDDLAIHTHDYPFANGAIGKVIVFDMEERQRLKLVEYDGATSVSRTDITDRLRDRGLDLRLDSFLDEGLLRRVAGAVRELYAERGFQYAEVTTSIRELAGGPKLAHAIFAISEGPKVAIRDVEFIGNRIFSDATLTKALKANKPQGLLSLVTRRGTYSAEKFADDAQSIVEHYRNHGYVDARVGQPALRVLDDSHDGRTRWVQLRVEVNEGRRYTLGDVSFAGNSVVPTEALRPLFEVAAGQPYREERFAKGLERARELYGSGGYFEFTAYPDLQPRAGEPPIVDVTVRVTEGKQYFVNRIEFRGNTLTRDSVIRRELNLVEGGVFNTEALKYSIRRLNQLGYFKPLEEGAVDVQRAAGADDRVDVTLRFEEQNRNQLNFGAGASQYDGAFVNFSYTTANFLGRGESLTVAAQTGVRSSAYQLSFSKPFVFERPITAGGSLYSRKVDFVVNGPAIDYSEVRSGFNLTSGAAILRFTRVFLTYGYEVIDSAMTEALRQSLQDESGAAAFLVDGRFIESSVTPTLQHNTVDNPFTPRSGRRLMVSAQLAGGALGGTSEFVKPEAELVWYLPLTRRTAFGVRAQGGRIWNFGGRDLPYYQRYFLGGEQQIRGVDIRSVGPKNSQGAALGGTAFALFNAEYYYDIVAQVRALAFHDAGQAYGERQHIDLLDLRTSTGVEVRVTLPVVNLPFRLIYAWNFYRDATQPARSFRFAVGSTF